MRVKIALGFFTLFFVLLLLGLFYFEVVGFKKFRELSEKNYIRTISQRGARGRIFDCNGIPLADSQLSYDLLLSQDIPLTKDEIFRVLRLLGKERGLSTESIERRYYSSLSPLLIATNLTFKEAISLGQLRVEIPSLVIQGNPVRRYPFGRLACHLIGYLAEIDQWRLARLENYGYKIKDMIGFSGLEEKFDYYLRDREGGISLQVDHLGRVARVLGFKPVQNGKDIELTIDYRIQRIVEEALAEKKGAVVIMDPFNGGILALVSSPGFYPEVFAKKDKEKIIRVLNDPDSVLLNRAISATYPAGSIFKLVVALAALENNKINRYSMFICQGSLKVGGQEFKCWDTHGKQDIVEAIAHSCNVFFYRTGLLTGAQLIYDYALRLGFRQLTGIDLPSEKAGFIPSPLSRRLSSFKNWFDGDTANLSIGQGEVSVTVLQVARMMAVFANGGYLVNPYLVKSIDGKRINRSKKKPEKINLKKENLAIIREGLRQAVKIGTANILADLEISVSGKTGTAQAPPRLAHAWFSGFFPSENPKFVICVLLEHGGSGLYACVVAKKIIMRMQEEGLI